MTSNPTILHVGPNSEFDLQKIEIGPFVCFAAYVRAYETRQYNDPGQDYLTISAEENSFSFALCDGVSQSFFGDFAAQHLGESLLSWLQLALPATLVEDEIKPSFTRYLNSLTGSATEEISQYQLPDSISPLLSDVLEQKRLYGSEAMFVCGRVDLPCKELVDGRVFLAWMGDSRLRAWRGLSPISLPEEFLTSQRWSSRRGVVGGSPNIFLTPIWKNGVLLDQIVSYSDGLAALDAYSKMPNVSSLRNLIHRTAQLHDSDDISFLQLNLRLPFEEILPSSLTSLEEDRIIAIDTGILLADNAPMVPEIFHLEAVDNTIQMSWHSVPSTTHYEISLFNGEQTVYTQFDCEWLSHTLSPNAYKIRLRAWCNNKSSDWTPEHVVKIPVSGVTGENFTSDWLPSAESADSYALHSIGLSALWLWMIVLLCMLLLIMFLSIRFPS